MDNTEYTLEPVTKKNVEDLRKIRIHKEQRGFIADIDSSLIQASFLPGWNGRILRYNNVIVGFGSYSEYNPDSSTMGAKINKIMIDRNHQGKGHGNKLLQMMLEDISSHGYKFITLNSNAKNNVAIALYKKYGFEVYKQCPKGTDVIMSKLLE
jgi:diamine N-acetyltransferase